MFFDKIIDEISLEEILDPLDLIQRYEEERASLNAEIDRVLADIAKLLGGNQE